MLFKEIFGPIAQRVDALRPELDALALDLHAHPELSFEEVRSSREVAEFLRRRGFAVEPVAEVPTAFRATRSFGGDRPRVVFMAEYDALPGVGHACGHNLIAGASVGAAAALADWMEARGVSGEVVCLGTPAEEHGGGKVELLKRGHFEGAEAALMFHAYPRTIIAKELLGVEEVVVEFDGKASHAAMAPEKGVNALDAMILLFNAVGLLRQQLPSDVRIHGIITDGGKAPNVIPERSAARFLIRTLDADFRAALRKRFVAAVEGAASATGCSFLVRTVGNPYAPMRQNRAMRALIAEALDALGEPYEEGPTTDEPVSTDAGNVSEALPTAHPYFGLGEAAGACHMVEFARAAGAPEGLSAMRKAAVTLACVGARILTDERVRKELWEDFRLGE